MLFLLTGTTLHKDIVYSVMSKYVWDNIAQHSYWCNVGPDHIVMFSKENNHVKCYLDMPEPTVHKKITCAILAHSSEITLHRKIIYNFVWMFLVQHYLRKLPVEFWPLAKNWDNFYEENNLYKVVATMLGQHCIGILSSQYCPNRSETTLQENYLRNAGPERADKLLQENRL